MDLAHVGGHIVERDGLLAAFASERLLGHVLERPSCDCQVGLKLVIGTLLAATAVLGLLDLHLEQLDALCARGAVELRRRLQPFKVIEHRLREALHLGEHGVLARALRLIPAKLD